MLIYSINDLYSKSSFIKNIINVPIQSYIFIICLVYLLPEPLLLNF